MRRPLLVLTGGFRCWVRRKVLGKAHELAVAVSKAEGEVSQALAGLVAEDVVRLTFQRDRGSFHSAVGRHLDALGDSFGGHLLAVN